MPTYDYECEACGHHLELFQSMSDKPKRKCPECKKSKLQRIIGSGGGVIFKGSGFYSTEYRSASYKAGEKADAPKPETPPPAGGCGMDQKTGVCAKPACKKPES